MANMVLPCTLTKRSMPYWADRLVSDGHAFSIGGREALIGLPDGYLSIANSENLWNYVPIADGLPANDCEVLMRVLRVSVGTENYTNTGGAIFFGSDKTKTTSAGYAMAISSGSTSSMTMWLRNADGGQTFIGSSASPSGSISAGNTILIRARRSGSSLSMKVWNESLSEPSSWQTTTTDSTFSITHAGIILHGNRLALKVLNLAVATGGDTASFSSLPVRVIGGRLQSIDERASVNVYAVSDHSIVASATVNTVTGEWLADLYVDEPVYVRVERGPTSSLIPWFAMDSHGYLGGDYPGGITTIEGVPAEAEVRAVLRSEDSILGGTFVAKTNSAPDGTWSIKGLTEGVSFDVVGRHPDHGDVVGAAVNPVPGSYDDFDLVGSIYAETTAVSGRLAAIGAELPITADISGSAPFGLSSANLLVHGEAISLSYTSRSYGDFTFSLDVTDSNSVERSREISITGLQRAVFADLVGSVSLPDRVSGTADMSMTIPAGVLADDLMVVAVMRRSGVSVSDNNGGTWTLAADAWSGVMYPDTPQGTSVYYRKATATDAGKTITVSCPVDGRLIPMLSVFRGRFAPLKVVSASVSPFRYDSTTTSSATSRLTPVTHTSGLLFRACSYYSSVTSGTTKAQINGMTNVGPETAPYATNNLRLQCGFLHLPVNGTTPEMFFVKSNTSSTQIIPEVVLIIDEDR